jgi:Anti-sigma-K factor rskA/Putative zinc-finger
MTHEEYQELLTASALTALEPADAAALGSHLESCSDCRAELSQLEDTAALIALDAKPSEPAADVRERILASIGKASPADFSSLKARPEPRVVPFVPPDRNVGASFGIFGAIAAIFVFAGLVISLVVLWRQNMGLKQDLARLTAEVNQSKAQVQHERAVVALLTSPDAHMAKLSGTNMAPSAHAMLAYDKDGHAMIMAKGLPAAPAGMAYQLWFIKDNKKMPGKVFTTDAAGNAMMEDEVPSVARESAVFAVTLEPEKGVQSPTGSIYLVSAS